MKDDLDISRKTEMLRELMAKHLGVKAKSFERACKNAGRRIPRRLRKPAARLTEALQMAQNPKLQRYLDAQALNADYLALHEWLSAKDHAEELKTRRLNLLALIVFQLLLIAVLLMVVLRWRGLI